MLTKIERALREQRPFLLVLHKKSSPFSAFTAFTLPFYSPCCAASIAVQNGDAGRFVKAVKAEKSNKIL
jgi:hypothetical protein